MTVILRDALAAGDMCLDQEVVTVAQSYTPLYYALLLYFCYSTTSAGCQNFPEPNEPEMVTSGCVYFSKN